MYFDRFPILQYLDTFGSVARVKLVTDILRRVNISTQGKEDSTFFIKYDLREGDTPENISKRLYNTSDYFWVVLLVNEALNPYYDFSMDSNSLENYVKKKYFGKYFYLVDTSDNKKPSGITFSADETIFSSTSNTDDFGVRQENFDVRARVVEHEPSLYRIRVDGGEHTYFAEGQLIGVYRGSSIEQAKIKRIEDGLYGLHGFETGTGDHVSAFAAPDGTPLGLTAATGTYANVAPRIDETRLGLYLGLSGDRSVDYVLTNFDYEIKKNEAKTSIQLIAPEYLSTVVSAFNELINV